MEFLPEDIARYAESHTTEENQLLKSINRETQAKVMMPRMLSGHLQGRTLAMLCQMLQPKCILEIGTYTGYSAICMAEGLANDGRLITIDINEELECMVRAYIEQAGLSNSIDYRIGDAMTLIPQISETLDLVFIDADKGNYINYYNLVFDKVRQGGYIIADNVLWSGKVAKNTEKMDKATAVIHQFNTMVQNDERVENLLLPIRDGLMVVRKY